MNAAMQQAALRRKNREAWVHRNTERGKAAAAAARLISNELRRAKKDRWAEWKGMREFARRQAKRGLYVLPQDNPGLREAQSCVACGTRQPVKAFGKAKDVCKTCDPQVAALTSAFASLHAGRARAREKLSKGVFAMNAAGTIKAELAPTAALIH